MFFSRLRCHYCGAKSTHDKSTTTFQCPGCEAVNFFDGKGNVVDTPSSHTINHFATEPRLETFTRALPESLEHQRNQAFCRTCAQNQLLYNETLANYLPDESHPKYREFEAAIPKYKADLEKRYPLVCRKCAPVAQTKINRADYYGMTQNAAKLAADTRARGGLPAYRTRDDMGKKSMRAVLRLVGLLLYVALLAQMVFHAYGIFNALFGSTSTEPEFTEIDDSSELAFNPSYAECARGSLRLQFNSSCYQLFSTLIPLSLTISACGLFYNPGLIQWYHHTHRIEAVDGQRNYFYMQAILLVFRSWAWFKLSDASFVAELDTDKLIGFHGAALFFILLIQAVATRGVESVLWTIKGKIMPKPADIDILGAYAGPEAEHYTAQASEKDPWRYLRKDETPFDIGSLAVKSPKRHNNSRAVQNFAQQPSPELSDDEDDYDAMETDYQPIMRSSQRMQNQRPTLQPRTTYQSGFANAGQSSMAFGGMTDQIFGMQSQQRQEQERQQTEQQQKLRFQPPPQSNSPFYGSLPPAPTSMERRLRNPVVRPIDPERVPLSQQKDFMAQMSKGVKPVQFPKQGNGSSFEMRQSNWVLPSDVKELGLEDRFQQTFSLADPSPGGESGKGGFFGGFFGR